MKVKRRMILTILLVVAINLTACSLKNQSQDVSDKQSLMYTNLADQATQEKVKNQLIIAGIQEETANEFIEWVNDYSNDITDSDLLQTGYQTVQQSPVDYSNIYINEQYREDGTLIPGMNCRLTAYLLFQQFIETKHELMSYDPYLMFDVETMEMEKRFAALNKEKFITIFEPVTVEENSTLEKHIEAIETAWKERGITIQDNSKVSLIMMYLHDKYENKRFVGHAGIMLDTEDGLMFVEKYGWDQPFQVTKFENEIDMIDYLLSRKDLVGDGSEEAVIVMKNDMVIG